MLLLGHVQLSITNKFSDDFACLKEDTVSSERHSSGNEFQRVMTVRKGELVCFGSKRRQRQC